MSKQPVVNVPRLILLLQERPETLPSETVEMVDATINYLNAVQDQFGDCLDTKGLDDLIEARRAYDGAGIVRLGVAS